MRYVIISFILSLSMLWGGQTLRAADVKVLVEIAGKGPRPYMVIWVEDQEGSRIKTLRVWGKKRKYYRHLKTWRATPERVDGITGATRPNGTYSTTWDGTDADGNPVNKGIYLIRVEAVREKGKHSLSTLPVNLGEVNTWVAGKADGDIRSLKAQVSP